MACRLSGGKLDVYAANVLPMLTFCQLYPWEQTKYNSNRNTNAFIHDNGFEYVFSEMEGVGSYAGKIPLT